MIRLIQRDQIDQKISGWSKMISCDPSDQYIRSDCSYVIRLITEFDHIDSISFG